MTLISRVRYRIFKKKINRIDGKMFMYFGILNSCVNISP